MGDPSEPQIGLLAEEVLAAYPRAVFLDERGRPKSIHYGILTEEIAREATARAATAAKAAIRALAEAL